jgi:methyl coenzyme M reductase alpha subunit
LKACILSIKETFHHSQFFPLYLKAPPHLEDAFGNQKDQASVIPHGTTTSATFCTFNAKQGLLKWAAIS